MKKTFNIMLMGAAIFSAVACSSPKTAESASQKSTSTIKEQVKKGAFVVDVRTPEEFADGSFPGAVNIPLDDVQSRIKEFEGKPSVIVFCRSGNRSGQAKKLLESNGIQNVTNGINVATMEEETK